MLASPVGADFGAAFVASGVDGEGVARITPTRHSRLSDLCRSVCAMIGAEGQPPSGAPEIRGTALLALVFPDVERPSEAECNRAAFRAGLSATVDR
jgi:hypothetical protein